jgi:hypothetical protein
LVVSGWYGSSRREKPLFDQRLQGRRRRETRVRRAGAPPVEGKKERGLLSFPSSISGAAEGKGKE